MIRSLANLCSFKVTEILQVQQPIIKPVLDTASIADINNSWAESLMSNSSHSKQTPPGAKKSEWSTYSPPRTDGIKTIGKFEREKNRAFKKYLKPFLSQLFSKLQIDRLGIPHSFSM